MTWRLRLVGTPTAQRDGDALPLPFERRSQIVALLALSGEWMRRSEVAALLWPELPRTLASTNLRKALFRLRDAPWSDALESDGDLMRMAVATDVDDFSAQVREGRLAQALSEHRGQLLQGFDDDANELWSDWLRTRRGRWHDAWRAAALQRLAEPLDSEEALALSAAMLQADPLDEAALQAQLEHLSRTGQAARARDAYRAFARRLEQELGVEPGSALRAAHQGLEKPAPAPAAAPSADDSYVGRVFEQRRIAELMQRADCRLLALVGPGGVGKTRLARQVLGTIAPLFEDGACFIALEDVDTPSAFIARVARSLKVASQPARDESESIAEHLSERQVLLVLDNFEPIALAATPLLGEWLDRAPRLKLLVTTRERLALGAQWALTIDGLPCPEPEDMDRLEDFDAPRLFIAAARRADPSLDLPSERAAIVDICRQVDGLPLALELAAAWTRVMRCVEIAREMRQGVELLRATNPAFPARQASLEAVFEHSWHLLGEQERRALATLSVFRGGFTLEAARAVASAPLPILGALADKSLVRKDGARLGLHPLVQQFAALKLGEGAAQAAACAAHARHFRILLTERQAKLRGSDAAALRFVDDEFENCWQAFHWLVANGPAEDLAPAVTALADHSRHRGYSERCLATMEAALAQGVVSREPAVRARLLAHIANQHFRLDRFAVAESTAREALALASGDDDVARETRRLAVYQLGSVALERGRFDEARAHYNAMLVIIGDAASARDRAIAVENLALVAKRSGRLDEALDLAHESLRLKRRLGEPHAIGLSLNNLASLHIRRREYDAAAPVLEEARALCETGGFSTTLAVVVTNQCELALARGNLEAAASLGERAVEMAQTNGQRMVLGWARAYLGRVALQRGDVAAARGLIAAACATALDVEAPGLQAVAVAAFAYLLRQAGHIKAAQRVVALAASERQLGEADRAGLEQLRLEWGAPAVEPGSGLSLDALLQRASTDSDAAHAALVAQLES